MNIFLWIYFISMAGSLYNARTVYLEQRELLLKDVVVITFFSVVPLFNTVSACVALVYSLPEDALCKLWNLSLIKKKG